MPKAEISWKRVGDDGESFQVYAQHVGREWRFFRRQRRYDQWQRLERPPLEDWLELLDALERLVPRRRYQPDELDRVRKKVRELFPRAEF
jgi:hypothetical protein